MAVKQSGCLTSVYSVVIIIMSMQREQNLCLMKSQMDSEYSDKEFKLNQRRRELQHLEDQLHMKSKDLKQKEFDIANAEGPADISGSQLAELADR